MSHVNESIHRFLPNPNYKFVGGSRDGMILAVELHLTEHGAFPPSIWTVSKKLIFAEPTFMPSFDVSIKASTTHERYRFVCTGEVDNVGHYEFIE